jgi:glyoxylase-like metal-dependent hydrolase (beta-lactamase superfamily II)
VPALNDLPIAGEWFARRRIDDAITLVHEPHVHPLLRCNVWHIRGRARDLVVDTAMGLHPLREVVDRELDGDLLAVATHAHADHVGGLHEFEHRAIHSAEADLIAAPGLASIDPAHYPDEVLGPYRAAGVAVPALFVDAAPPGGIGATAYEVSAAPATRLLAEGDVIDLGDRAFEVLHLPGHSPGSIGLWEPSTGTLFSGDAIYDGPLLDELEGSDIEQYVETIRRLRELPVTVVHGGHEDSFGRGRLIEICDSYLATRR